MSPSRRSALRPESKGRRRSDRRPDTFTRPDDESAWAVSRSLFDLLTAGVALLDLSTVVLDMNASAQAIVASGDGLLVEDSRLRALRVGDDLRLQRVLWAAVGRRAGTNERQLLAVPRRSGRRPYLLIACQIRPAHDASRADAPRAAIWVTDPERDVRPSPDALRELWGLTGREAEVAALVASGLDRAGIAAELAISREAVRLHLDNVFRKTRTKSLAALVGLTLRSTSGAGV